MWLPKHGPELMRAAWNTACEVGERLAVNPEECSPGVVRLTLRYVPERASKRRQPDRCSRRRKEASNMSS